MKHVFISYIKENSEIVNKMCNELNEHGITVWRDKDDIEPGMFWKDSIRDAIEGGDYFIACFSREYNRRSSTYMNEELVLAIDELRKRNYMQIWFIPVLFSGKIPRINIGAGKTLRDFQYVELNDSNWETGINKILSVINPVIVKTGINKKVTGLRYLNIPAQIMQSIQSHDGIKSQGIITKVLDIAVITLAQGNEEEFRSSVMLVSNRKENEVYVAYTSSNMLASPEKKIKLHKWQGVAGQSWGHQQPVVGDLNIDVERVGGASWGLSPEQKSLTKNINAILSVPMFSNKNPKQIVGILNFDTDKPLGDFLLHDKTVQIAQEVAETIVTLLDK